MDLREALKKITDQNLPNAQICIVRERVADLLYHCEPINTSDYLDKDVLDMSPEELVLSKKNWIYDCRLTANDDIANIITGDDGSTGIYQLPKLNSKVAIIPLNDEDAVIITTSEIGTVTIKGDAGTLNMSVDEFAQVNKNVLKFSKMDLFSVLSDKGANLNVSDNVTLTKDDNYISVRDTRIDVYALNPDSSLNLKGNGVIVSAGDAIININDDEKIKIFNNSTSLDQILDDILDLIFKVNEAIVSGAPDPYVRTAGVVDVKEKIKKLLK